MKEIRILVIFPLSQDFPFAVTIYFLQRLENIELVTQLLTQKKNMNF